MAFLRGHSNKWFWTSFLGMVLVVYLASPASGDDGIKHRLGHGMMAFSSQLASCCPSSWPAVLRLLLHWTFSRLIAWHAARDIIINARKKIPPQDNDAAYNKSYHIHVPPTDHVNVHAFYTDTLHCTGSNIWVREPVAITTCLCVFVESYLLQLLGLVPSSCTVGSCRSVFCSPEDRSCSTGASMKV